MDIRNDLFGSVLVCFTVRILMQTMTTGRERAQIGARFVGLPCAIPCTRQRIALSSGIPGLVNLK